MVSPADGPDAATAVTPGITRPDYVEFRIQNRAVAGGSQPAHEVRRAAHQEFDTLDQLPNGVLDVNDANAFVGGLYQGLMPPNSAKAVAGLRMAAARATRAGNTEFAAAAARYLSRLEQQGAERALRRFSVADDVAVRFRDLKQQLEDAWPWQRDSIALEFVESLTEHENAQLTLEMENDLVESLKGFHLTIQELNAVKKLYAVDTRGLELGMPDLIERLAEKLAGEIIAMDCNWDDLSTSARLAILQHFVNATAEVFELQPVQVQAVERVPRSDDSGVLVAGLLEDGRFLLNTIPEVLDDLGELIGTVVHELTHAYQSKLVAQLENGELDEADPRYQRARAFALNSGHLLMKPWVDFDLYCCQPVERHAYVTQAGVMGAVWDRVGLR